VQKVLVLDLQEKRYNTRPGDEKGAVGKLRENTTLVKNDAKTVPPETGPTLGG